MLNEKQHAFIAAQYYRLIHELDPAGAERVFLFCTRKYAEERGARMAQRALRDGCELTLGTYMSYGEWEYTDPSFSENEVLETAPDHHYLVHKCPWNTQFSEMGAMDCAESYCRDLDLSLARGFNPDVHFETRSTMHSAGVCDFTLHGAGEKPRPPRDKNNQRPFAFHCGHLLATFARCVGNIYGSRGYAATAEVERRFGEQYGQEALGELLANKARDFSSINA